MGGGGTWCALSYRLSSCLRSQCFGRPSPSGKPPLRPGRLAASKRARAGCTGIAVGPSGRPSGNCPAADEEQKGFDPESRALR